MSKLTICPEDVLMIKLMASQIPDRSTVMKVTGALAMTLVNELVVYPVPKANVSTPAQPLKMDGFFLIGPRGAINQVPSDLMLLWIVGADEFKDMLEEAWRGEDQ